MILFFYQWCSLGVSKTGCALECIDLDFFKKLEEYGECCLV
jgi:hypothetical protein